MSFIVGLGMSLGWVVVAAGMLLVLNVVTSAILALSIFIKNKLHSSLLFVVPFRKLVSVTFRAWLTCVLIFFVLQTVGRLTQVGWVMLLSAMFPLLQQVVSAAFFFFLLRTAVSHVGVLSPPIKRAKNLWAFTLALVPAVMLTLAASFRFLL